MNNLALAYLDNKQPSKALPLLEQTLDKMKARLGADHPDTLTTMSALGGVYRRSGQWAKALPLLEEALAGHKAKRGLDHPNTLIAMNNLAMAYRDAGKLDKALPLFREALARKKATLGDGHPQTLLSMANLAWAYQRAGQLAEAVPLFELALDGLKVNPGAGNPTTLQVTDGLATAYFEARRYADAERLLALWIAEQRPKVPADPLGLALRLNKLGACQSQQQKYEEAEKALRESLTIYRQKRPKSANCYETESLLGAALAGRKKYADAEPLLVNGAKKLLVGGAKVAPAVRTRAQAAVHRVVELYDAWERPEDAARWRNELEALNSR
jgi:tetratricopeptide (TPR) repeat protein